MKKIIILIAILCGIGFCDCAITKDPSSVEFKCKPSIYELETVKQVNFYVFMVDDDIYSITETTIYKDNSKIIIRYTSVNSGVSKTTTFVDAYGIREVIESLLVNVNLRFLYLDFKKEYNL